jgi:putative endonuclease
MMTNERNTVLYVGVTGDLLKRVWEHKQGVIDGFTKKYRCIKLVYYETTSDVWAALHREKELKGWKREKKNFLINRDNPSWQDLDIS